MSRKLMKEKLNSKSPFSRIVVKFKDHLGLPYHGAKEINDYFSQKYFFQWKHLLNLFPGINIDKLFTSLEPRRITELITRACESDHDYQPLDFLSYYAISCPEVDADELLTMIVQSKIVEVAYRESTAANPPSVSGANPLSRYQGYLNPAPVGINARYAWNVNGGDGKGNVKFIDIEQGWISDHEDMIVNTLPGSGINHQGFEEHGAAVLGIVMMKDNSLGGIGITPKVNGHVISQWRKDGSFNTADAILAAIDNLCFGDIVLLEAQTSDPKSEKVWPVEIEDAIFQAIRLATASGIIVIEAAGNGNLNLTTGNDLDVFELKGKRILDPMSSDFRDSGGIIVAAASSSPGHKKIDYSNYGKRINCYAWGQNVVTAGNYPRSSGIAINMYIGDFGGTSSASAIIAGSAIAIQSIVEANHQYRLSPKQMRDILSDDQYGTSSENGRSPVKIGVMPDLKKIIDNALNSNGVICEIKE